jgi:hypothetical protein
MRDTYKALEVLEPDNARFRMVLVTKDGVAQSATINCAVWDG